MTLPKSDDMSALLPRSVSTLFAISSIAFSFAYKIPTTMLYVIIPVSNTLLTGIINIGYGLVELNPVNLYTST